jgi:hypothetical protein
VGSLQCGAVQVPCPCVVPRRPVPRGVSWHRDATNGRGTPSYTPYTTRARPCPGMGTGTCSGRIQNVPGQGHDRDMFLSCTRTGTCSCHAPGQGHVPAMYQDRDTTKPHGRVSWHARPGTAVLGPGGGGGRGGAGHNPPPPPPDQDPPTLHPFGCRCAQHHLQSPLSLSLPLPPSLPPSLFRSLSRRDALKPSFLVIGPSLPTFPFLCFTDPGLWTTV